MFRFTGQVLEGVRVSPANQPTTEEPSDGVVRDVREVPGTYITKPGAPSFIDARADQWRAAVIDAPGTTPQEWLVWAENTSQLALVDDPDWWTSQGLGTIPENGVLDVPDVKTFEIHTDGSSKFLVTDDGNRSIGTVLLFVAARGDVDYDDNGWEDPNNPSAGRKGDNPYPWWFVDTTDQNPVSGVVTLSAAQLVVLGGGLSPSRGDSLVEVRYTIAPSRFWWTKNDRYETRFGWNGKTQRWEPWKGSPVKNLGLLLLDQTTFHMDPKVRNLPVGSFLPGDLVVPDSWSMIRLGSDPGVTSIPVAPDSSGASDFSGVLVQPDSEIADFDFGLVPDVAGVMGQSGGELSFNPAFVRKHAGKTVWYSYRGFSESETGVVGKLLDAKTTSLFLAPLPGPTDFPIIRFGNRTPVAVQLFLTDADMNLAVSPSAGVVYVSLATGRLVISQADLAKSDPDNVTAFDKQWYGADVIYDGVALNQIPQPSSYPVPLVDIFGNPQLCGPDVDFYIPDASMLPGLGLSGILQVSDRTGSVPMAGVVGTRPGGDNPGDANTGLIRSLSDGVGDTILFSKTHALTNIRTVTLPADLPDPGKVRTGWATVCLKNASLPGLPGLSQVILSKTDIQAFADDYVYFLQSSFTPAVYTTTARIYSRNRDIFRFDGTEVFHFAFTTPLIWNSASLISAFPEKDFFTAEEVAASIDAIIPPGDGRSWALNGRIILEADDPDTGTVEIGWGVGGVMDLSGAAALGFLPGWKASGGVANRLPDSGAAVGLFRSPLNLDRRLAIPDFAHVERLRGAIVYDSIPPNPFTFLTNPPLEDVAGYDEGVFFNLVNTVQDGDNIRIVSKYLENWSDVVYRFGQGKFDWVTWDAITEPVNRAITTINLGHSGVVQESMRLAPGIPGYLSANVDGEGDVWQDPDNDYIMPQGGITGTATFIRRFGKRVLSGAQGSFSAGAGTFSDPSVNFTDPRWGIQPGFRLKITSSEGEGSYTVSTVSSLSLQVAPLFLVGTTRPATWELFEGFVEDVYDPMLVADVLYQNLSPLPDEPFKVRVLSPLGVVPETASDLATNRPKAEVEGALSSGRPVSVRYGAVAPSVINVASLTWLTKTDLGIISNTGIIVPIGERFDALAFSIQVGTANFSFAAGSLFAVTAFSPDPGDAIECLTVSSGVFPKGQLKFGSLVLSKFPQARVLAVDEFMPPALLLPLQAECDPVTGEINYSQSDMDDFHGIRAYFVEQMITDNDQDVSIQPMTGTCAFFRPLPKGVLVEMAYWASDLEGRKVGNEIVEFLPVFIRNEVAKRDRPNVFTYNASGDTINRVIEPIVFVRGAQQNYGEVNYVVDYTDIGRGRLTFVTYDITDDCDVKVTYAVAEAQGGERVYETSTKPVYRPPFFIKTAQNRFGLHGDRRSEFKAGQLLRIGGECFYVKGVRYFPPVIIPPVVPSELPAYKQPISVSPPPSSGDITAVYIYPPTIQEVGSRAPGRDVFLGITPMAVTPVVDPFGDSPGPYGSPAPVPTDAALGIMFDLDLTDFPFEPVNRGQTTIVFKGDLTRFSVPGHILEIGGVPYTISGADLTVDGSRTNVSLTSGIRKSFTVDRAPPVRLTWRPIYPPNCRTFLGVGPFVQEEGWELVLWGESGPNGENPGRTLVPNSEYVIDQNSGAITLLEPFQNAMNAPQRLSLSYTLLRGLQPWVKDGVVGKPSWTALYLHSESPSEENGILGGTLAATYTFRNPDTFYVRSAPLEQLIVDVTAEVVQEINSKQPASGAPKPVGKPSNWNQGRVGLRTERKHLTDKDRVARTFLDFYNTAINAFEQIEETISGDIIGDSDGKFRHWVGRGKEWFTPGYEDPITGVLTRRDIWTEVFSEWLLPGTCVYFQPTDPIVDPWSFTLTDGVIDGETPDLDFVQSLMDTQKSRVRNEVDDYVLSGTYSRRSRRDGYPYFKHILRGRFSPMFMRHKYSRLFPTWTKTFLRTNPGLDSNPAAGDPGFFTAGRYFYDSKRGEKIVRKTTGDDIGQVQNPVLGDITSVNAITLFKRRASARVWGYFPDGIAAGAFGTVGGIPVPAVPVLGPCFVATPLSLKDFPINPSTGWPDVSQLASVTATGVADLMSGDPDMAIPGFLGGLPTTLPGGLTISTKGDQIALGKPDGTVWRLCDADGGSATSAGIFSLRGIFVNAILYGCIMTLQDGDGNVILDPARVLLAKDDSTGAPADTGVNAATRGDTLMSISKDGAAAPDNPPTSEELEEIAESSDSFRIGFDVSVFRDGRIVDMTFPSVLDPRYFGIKEVLGQNPPEPLSCIGGSVNFTYEGQNPVEVPALNGEALDDSGDRAVPYLKVSNTELDRFEDGGSILADVLKVDTLAVRPLSVGGPWGVWPDEFVGNDGTAMTEPPLPGVTPDDQPGSLMTMEDLGPRKASPPAPAAPWGNGTANVRPHDILFVQVQDIADPTDGPFSAAGLPIKGPQGIQSVGRVRLLETDWNLDPSGVIDPRHGIGSLIETPRFVTRTSPPAAPPLPDTASPVRHAIENALVHVSDPQPPDPPPVTVDGVKIYAYKARQLLIFDLTGTNFTLHDGQTEGVGGLNNLWSGVGAKANNKIVIQPISRKDSNIQWGPGGADVSVLKLGGVVVMTFTIQGTNITTRDYWTHPPGTTTFTNAHFGESIVSVLGGTLPGIVSDQTDPRYIILENVVDTDLLKLWQTPSGAPPHPTSTWFIPYTETADPGFPGTWFQTMNYGEDVSIGVDTTATGESTTAWIDEDRLTFHEAFDLRWMKERGFTHPLNATTILESRFAVKAVTVGQTTVTSFWSDIDTYCNGADSGGNPLPYTFLARAGVIGTWVPRTATVSEDGSVAVMGFEGWQGTTGNIPVLSTLATFSAAPSNEFCWIVNPAGLEQCVPICSGTGVTESRFSIIVGSDQLDDRITSIGVTLGDMARIEPGDVAVVSKSVNATHLATTKAGTYLVRHAIAENIPVIAADQRVTAPSIMLGVSDVGWCPLQFPTVVSWNTTTFVLELSDMALLPTPVPTTWGVRDVGFPPAPGYVYILLNPEDLKTVDPLGTPEEYAIAWAKFQKAVLRLRYTSLIPASNEMVIDATACVFADGAAISLADLNSLMSGATCQVSGMQVWPINVSGAEYGLPDDNVVGYDNGGAIQMGFEMVTLTRGAGTTPIVLTFPGNFVPRLGTPIPPNVFDAYEHAPVYDRVVCGATVDGILAADWKDLNVPATAIKYATAIVNCILPGTTAAIADLTVSPPDPKHHAVAGIYFQPAFPRQALDLIADHPRVVDAQWSLPLPDPLPDPNRELGMRDSVSYSMGVAPVVPSEIEFTIRRIRRFHSIEGIDLKLEPLRHVWEIRRGRITAYTSDKQRGVVTARQFTMDFDIGRVPGDPKTPDVWNDGKTYSGTNLGLFTDTDTNIHAGDMFRLLASDGTLLEETRIETILNGWTLRLASPGLVSVAPGSLVGMRFEVWLHQMPVPQEQSCEQILDLITDSEVCRTDATWGGVDEQGGYVPEYDSLIPWTDQTNLLFDDLNADGTTPSKTFGGLGVQVGDIVIVDPLGTIPMKGGLPVIQEKGVRPIGDEGVPGRKGWMGGVDGVDTFRAGFPSALDDNRGFWRVVKVADSESGAAPHLILDPLNTFSGDLDANVVFDPTDVRRAYAVVPTVSASMLNRADPDPDTWLERQMDLRPTKARNAVTGRFSTTPPTWHSIRPFSYRIIRPSSLFSTESLDLALHTRERMLSLIELVGRGFDDKNGNWWDFQNFLHVHDLGFTWNPESGLGVLRNVQVMAVLGRTDVTPFMNNEGCLSFLDRRFWILDKRLDNLVPSELADHRPYGMKIADHAAPPESYTAWDDISGSKVRPVLPERIDEVLDQRDRFRPIRYVWLAYRTHEILGTLAAITRFDVELPERRVQQLEALLKLLTLENAT
jgi:hypothetical protein